MPPHAPHARDGRALEDLIAGVFSRRGYDVARNVLLTGGSGARYEVDVLAVRPDALVTSRVAVECKNLGRPVDAQVVARMALMVRDARLGAGVVAAPGGHTPAAAAAAEDAGIALWTRADIAAHAGDAALAGLDPPAAHGHAPALARATGDDRAAHLARLHVRGAWGLGRGTIEPLGPAWLPVHELAVHHTRDGRRGRRSAHVALVRCEALTGRPVRAGDAPWDAPGRTLDAPALAPGVAASALGRAVADAAARRDRAVQPATRERHRAALEALGVDPDAEDVRVDGARTVHVPVWVAAVTRRGEARAVVVDASGGRVDDVLGDAATARLEAIRRSM